MTRYELRKQQAPSKDLAPLCSCGCGTKVNWLIMKNRWAVCCSGHNQKYQPPSARVDFQNPTWCYLLGAHFGDGCDSRRIDIAVGKDESGWADSLAHALINVGLIPRINSFKSVIRVRASSQPIMQELALWKHGGKQGLWSFPFSIPHLLHFLAGLIDSDGQAQETSGAMIIYQRDNGNLERLQEVLNHVGYTTTHLGKDWRTENLIDGRTIAAHWSARLGIRGDLRDSIFPYLRNPVKIRAWKTYREKSPLRV